MKISQLSKKIVFFGFIFALSLHIIVDPDFGWHLRAGEYIIHNQSIPKHDIFSYTLPNYPYVYHSWGAETLLFIAYKSFGLWGTAIFFALLLTASIFFLIKTSLSISKGQIIIPVFLASTLLAYATAGGRMRIFNLLFLSITCFLFEKYEAKNTKIIFLLPLVFFLWANFHGSFLIGIFLLPVLFILSKNKTIILFFVFLISFLATLLNPYFTNAWKQALQMPAQSYIHISNLNPDWQSLVLIKGGLIICTLYVFFIASLFFQKTKTTNPQKLLIVIFFLLSLISSRFVIWLIVFSIPQINLQAASLIKKIPKEVSRSIFVRFSPHFIYLIFTLLATANILEMSKAYKSPESYSDFMNKKASQIIPYQIWPYQANTYMSTNLSEKRILNEANGAGFLLLQYPQTKLFYYGAMDNFIQNGQSFAYEYHALSQAQNNWEQKLENFQIEAVNLPPNFPLSQKLRSNPNWQIAYEDEAALIFIKKKNN